MFVVRSIRSDLVMKKCSLFGMLVMGVFALAQQAPRSGTPAIFNGTQIVVANRNDGTVSLIDNETERVMNIVMGEGSEPMYVQNPYFSNEIWIGDRGHDRVLVYDASRLALKAEVPTGKGIFHMWNHGGLGQMWVVCDVDKVLTVISLETKEVLATVPIPAELATEYKPHDMTVTADGAIVSLLGAAGDEDWIIKYSGSDFTEVARLQVPGDPHLMHWGFEGSDLYVASQAGGKVFRVNPENLEVIAELDIPGAHGIWANEQETLLYVGNITSANGQDAIHVIDLTTFSPVAGSPVASALPKPHNVMVSVTSDKLYMTHSGGDSTSTTVYDLGPDGLPTSSRILTTGSNPFGIMLMRNPVCVNRFDYLEAVAPYLSKD